MLAPGKLVIDRASRPYWPAFSFFRMTVFHIGFIGGAAANRIESSETIVMW